MSTTRARHLVAAALCAGVSLTTPLAAQWPTTPATNLAIADAAGEQTLAKIGVTIDGGCYIGWFDNQGGSYAVRLQRLSPTGAELWPHGGIVVSNNPQSTSLVDWDLIADSQGGCVLTFTDTRAGGDLDVYAYRFSPTTTPVWGANGIALSNNGDYEANPRVVETTDGEFAFVWSNGGTASLQLQWVSAIGNPRFAGDGIAIPGDAGATPGFVRVAAGLNGEVILSWVRTITFSGNKHVHAQKFDSLGVAQWNGGTRIAVFDQASVPIAHDPRLLPDQAGGAVLAWHFAQGQQFSIRTQHLLANGTEAFPHNGVDVSTSGNSRFDPAITWLPGLDQLSVVWNERNLGQTSWGIFAQRLDSTGAALWGPTGVTLLPIDTTTKFAPVAAQLGTGVAAAVLVQSLGLLDDAVVHFALDANGVALGAPSTTVSTAVSDKLRLALATTASGTSLMAWTDQRSGAADIYGQAIGLDGVLGVTPAVLQGYGCGLNPALSLTSQGSAAFGQSLQLQLRNPLLTQPAGTAGFLFYGTQAMPGFPCGAAVPGFGMAAPGAAGELLVDLGAPYTAVFAGLLPTPSSALTAAFGVPFVGSLMGVELFVQGLLADLTPGAPIPFGLSTGIRLQVGS